MNQNLSCIPLTINVNKKKSSFSLLRGVKICFTSEHITFSKYAFYFINNSLYFITLYILNSLIFKSHLFLLDCIRGWTCLTIFHQFRSILHRRQQCRRWTDKHTSTGGSNAGGGRKNKPTGLPLRGLSLPSKKKKKKKKKKDFILGLLSKGYRQFVKMVPHQWTRWPPCRYMIKKKQKKLQIHES